MTQYACVELKSIWDERDAHVFQQELPEGWQMYDGEWMIGEPALLMHIDNEDGGSMEELIHWVETNDPQKSGFDIMNFNTL